MRFIVNIFAIIGLITVVGINDNLKGQLPIGLVVVKSGIEVDEMQLQTELVALVREKIGAVACFRKAFMVLRLPKTRSGKILRKTIRQIAAGIEYTTPPTIDDPASLTEITKVLQKRQA
ncbi:hypothetical protein QUF50_10160 [Thiotrichales bacterium HSG1]|nr:hypothetical protein [Thiotrichales bacterium HSG1]